MPFKLSIGNVCPTSALKTRMMMRRKLLIFKAKAMLLTLSEWFLYTDIDC